MQGVGFRYTASSIAGSRCISGWVRNLDDGTVEMEAEGTTADVDALVDSLKNLRWGSVDRIEAEDVPLHGDYSFEIV